MARAFLKYAAPSPGRFTNRLAGWIDTHWHFDHTDGNSTFAEDQTTVVGHANCRARMSQDQFVPSLEWSVRSSPRLAWPVLTFNAAVSIDLGSQTLELMPQEPAHTDGDVVVWLPSANVLVMGDLMTNGSYPVIDESSCGSLHGMIRAIERLLPFINAETTVVPGHWLVAAGLAHLSQTGCCGAKGSQNCFQSALSHPCGIRSANIEAY
jgi:cyclase